jgi:DNA-binding NtrC family response regulator
VIEIKKIDVKLISASNQNLKELVNQKKFREDLYYRIATFNIVIPPLRERIEDIPLLTDYFLERLSKKFDREITITPAALKILMQLEWQGNVRELENTLERAIITSNDSVLKENSFKFYLQSSPNKSNLNGFASQSISLKDMEKEYIKKTLEDCKWNKVKASRVLGIDRKTLVQ